MCKSECDLASEIATYYRHRIPANMSPTHVVASCGLRDRIESMVVLLNSRPLRRRKSAQRYGARRSRHDARDKANRSDTKRVETRNASLTKDS